jgi:thiosulfate/3-mercaptopyruvate sulfurtransferase
MNRKVRFLSIVLILAIAAAMAGAAAGAAGTKAGAAAGPAGAKAHAKSAAGASATAAAGAKSAAGASATAEAGAEQTDPWTPAQLMEPADLAARLKDIAADPPLIICVGPSGVIKGSVETGPAHEGRKLDSLRRLLDREDRQREIIIYCGCCPFKNCPNVRPAFSLLLYMGFKHPRLLDLSTNIKVDWIDKGYPVTSR